MGRGRGRGGCHDGKGKEGDGVELGWKSIEYQESLSLVSEICIYVTISNHEYVHKV